MPATIGPGSVGDDVKRLQRVLARHLEWSPFGPITGTYDTNLETSVKNLQGSYGLTVDGICGPATWAKLPAYREASPVLQAGSSGPVVAWLQRALAGTVIAVAFAPYTGAIDGVFGPATETAVKALQSWAGMTADGIIGDDTWFIWLTPGSAQQLTLEGATQLLTDLL